MMIHNLIKYLVQTRLRLWDIKITNFKPESCPDDLLEICYFYISQTKSSLNKIFYKVVYHHIIYMYDFFGEFRQFFCRGLHKFSRRLWFSPDMFPCWYWYRYQIRYVSDTWIPKETDTGYGSIFFILVIIYEITYQNC